MWQRLLRKQLSSDIEPVFF